MRKWNEWEATCLNSMFTLWDIILLCVCLSMCVCHIYTTALQRSHETLDLWYWSYRRWWATTWVAGTELRYSERTASVLNPWAILPGPRLCFKKILSSLIITLFFLLIWTLNAREAFGWKGFYLSLALLAHAFDINACEVEAGRSLWIWDKSGLQNKL